MILPATVGVALALTDAVPFPGPGLAMTGSREILLYATK
jgi:GMP synthase PP-ATPase subunit